MKIRCCMVVLLVLVLIFGNAKAELPYESNQKHSFVVTGGLKKNDRFNDNFQNSFSINYSFQNKISIGISYRDFAGSFIYEGAGFDSSSGPLNTDASYEQSSINERGYKYPERAIYSLYAHLKPLNILHIEAPILFSLFVAVQDVLESKYIVEFLGIPDISEGKNFTRAS